ncbi:MAG TPA: hypothetical protein VFX39_00460 [Gemmatimonadaceae bacterium]|nr:hypothetical protein [Gemmatimonadaceae bacterium]
MRDHIVSRDTLYARLDALAYGRTHGDSWAAHAALLDRLAANRRAAEAQGWTSCALERIGGFGRLTAWGVPPGDVERHPIPDWLPDWLLGVDR